MFSFGNTTPATTSGPTFGGFGTTSTTPGGLTFGAPNTNAANLGGAATQQSTGFTFGNAAATPAASTAPNLSFGSGFNFKGTATTTSTTPGFGLTATPSQPAASGFNLTSTQAQPSTGGLRLTSTVQPATGGLSLTSTPAQPTAGGFSLTATSTQAAGGGFNVASTQASTAAGGFNLLNTTTSTPAGMNLTLGMTPQQQTGSTSTGLFSTPQTTATSGSGFSMPASSASAAKPTMPTLAFATPATTTSATATTTTGFLSAAKTTATSGFSLTPSTSTTGGLFGLPTSAATTSTPATTASSSVFKGLGGIDTTQSLSGIVGSTGGAGGRPESKTVKDNQVPNDIITSIESFKAFVKNQKNLSCEVARASVKPMAKVTEDTEALQQLLSSLASEVQKNNILAERLKAETTQGFAQCEMAQRTHDTPAGLQNDNSAPLDFFMNLAAQFEHNVQVLRQEIDNTEKYVTTLNQPSALTPQELSLALKKLHESFISLAGRLQIIHQSVVAQKERHLSLRRHFLKDATDIFSKEDCMGNKKSGIVAGPTPFSGMGSVHTLGILANQEKGVSSFSAGWGTPQPVNQMTSIAGGGLFGTGSSFSSVADNSSFQLKTPPGTKRGKR